MAKKKPTTELVTVPTFTFNQGDIFDGNGNVESERPIRVLYYNGTIELVQDGDYPQQPERILICTEYLKELFNEIQAHLPEAEKRWK